jgi:hypothetical protein
MEKQFKNQIFMKQLAVFLTGAVSTLGVSAVVPTGPVTDTVANGVHAVISILGGILSTIIIEYIKRKWGNQTDSKSTKK